MNPFSGHPPIRATENQDGPRLPSPNPLGRSSPGPPGPAHLVLDLDQESAGKLAGALLSGEPCAIPVGGLLLSTWSDAGGTRLRISTRGPRPS